MVDGGEFREDGKRDETGDGRNERHWEKCWEFWGKTRSENCEAEEETRDDGEGKLRGETSCSQWENSMGIRLSQRLHLSREGEFLPCIIIAQGPPLSSPAVPVASVSPTPCPRETANNQYSMNAHYT